MSTSTSESIFHTKRWWLLGGVLVVLILISVFGNSGKPPGDSTATRGSESGASASDAGDPAAQRMADSNEAEAPRATRSSLKRNDPELELDASQFPQVQQILADAALSEQEAAVSLLSIIVRSELPEAERDEALAHGLNLDFKAFAALATDPSLPLPLAQRYFDGLANRDDLPQQQVEGYLGLMGHADESIRAQATQQLAFLLENEALAEAPEALRRAALERIETLKAAPPVLNQPVPEELGSE